MFFDDMSEILGSGLFLGQAFFALLVGVPLGEIIYKRLKQDIEQPDKD